jgi:hypothetical protein
VLSTSGHIQALIKPRRPDSRSSHREGRERGAREGFGLIGEGGDWSRASSRITQQRAPALPTPTTLRHSSQ